MVVSMALIKCVECGHEVSENAKSCPNCGSPIEKGLVCRECGASLSPIDEVCPNCGNPIYSAANMNSRKSIIYVLFAILTVIILSVAYVLNEHFANNSDGVITIVDTVRVTNANVVSYNGQSQEEKDREEQARLQYLKREKQRELRERQRNNEASASTSTNSNRNANANTNSGNSSIQSYRFFNAASVLDYLQNKTFANGRSRVKIKFEGVYINGSCLTGAPIVERFETYKAIVRASVVGGGGTFRVMVDPTNNRLLDQDGTIYYLKK